MSDIRYITNFTIYIHTDVSLKIWKMLKATSFTTKSSITGTTSFITFNLSTDMSLIIRRQLNNH